jgi:hypothetical protein
MYPDIKYDGNLFCYLLQDDTPPMEEKYPPGTQVEHLDLSTKILLAGTVVDILLSGIVPESSDALTYHHL